MAVTLGYVDSWSRPLRQPRGQPWDSRAGGLPAFFADRHARPVCAACGRPMFLVLQLYAPTDVERSLLIFGCNSVACNKSEPNAPPRLGSWKVVRSQGGPVQAEVVTAAPEPAPAPAAAASDWGGSGGWGDEDGASGFGGGAATGDDWGAASSGFGEDTALLAALTSQVAGLEVTPTATPAAGGESEVTKSAGPEAAPYPPTPEDVFAFPAYAVESCEEPYPDEDEEDDAEDAEEEEGSGEHAGVAKRIGGGGGGSGSISRNSKVDGIWRAYQAWEAETAKAPAQSEEGVGGGACGGGAGGEEDDHDNEEDEEEGYGDPGGKRSGKAKRRKGDDAEEDEGAGGGGGGGGGGERYESLPRRLRYNLSFQARVKRLPSQVVRYAYGSTPLLPVPPEDVITLVAGRVPGGQSKPALARDIPVPRCEGCGARRQFEAQLMPSLLFGLRVDEHTAEDKAGEGSAAAAAGSGGALASLFGGGMDFSTVLVYSCEASCAASHEEVAIAIPTP